MPQEIEDPIQPLSFQQMTVGKKFIHRLDESHDSEILQFFNRVGMAKGRFRLLMKRAPHYFDLLRHRGGRYVAFALRDRAGHLAGTGTASSTAAYVGSQIGHCVYMCDLRIDCRDREVAQEWKQTFGLFLRDARRLPEIGERAKFITAVIEGNERARRVVEDQSYAGQRLVTLTPYSMVTLLFKKPWARTKTTPFRVERGAHLQELEIFLHSVHREQAFGNCFAAPHYELQRRLRDWKNFSLQDFLVVRNNRGQIVAATALWNPNHCKQTIVEGPGWTKAFNFFSRWLSLPQFGLPLEIVYFTHLSFSWDLSLEQKQIILGQLVDVAWSEKRKRKAHALAFADFKEFSLLPGVKNYLKAEVPVKMYISVPEEERESFQRESLGRFPPAFEIALV